MHTKDLEEACSLDRCSSYIATSYMSRITGFRIEDYGVSEELTSTCRPEIRLKTEGLRTNILATLCSPNGIQNLCFLDTF
jgi:hypothetical protein